MTLPSANLDDKTFAQLLEDAKKLIPRFAPEWTDHNIHDPGITFIELFAWLVESQQYYLNRIREENYLKFLKLLGVKQKQSSRAVVDVTFSSVRQMGEGMIVPKGTSVLADQVVFETSKSLTVVIANLKKIISFSGGGWFDQTEANSLKGLSYMAFGEKAESGSALYLGFSDDKLFPASGKITLTFNVFEDYRDNNGNRVSAVRGSYKNVPSGTIVWEYFKKSQYASGVWAPLKIIKDETEMLSRKGRICFLAPGDMAARIIKPFTENCYWIRATVHQEGFELPPRLESVMLNTVPAIQQETLSEVLTFSRTGCKSYSFEATGLSLYGCNYLQVLNQNGTWNDWPDCKIEKKNSENKITIIFEPGRIPPKGRKNLRLVSHRSEWAENGLIGVGTGLPNQKIRLETVPVIPQNLILQVGEELNPADQGYLSWRDWIAVDDFDASGPEDNHFMLDPENGEIMFGDGVNGAIPPNPSDKQKLNIRLISYRAGGGEKGNVLPGAVIRIASPVMAEGLLKVENKQPAFGGISSESLEETKVRARRKWRQGFRAVTFEDYERLACATPGIRVARAKAIPLYQTDLATYPKKTVPATVTVVVVPFSFATKPVPSKGFMKNVFCHLNKHRLITTELHVTPPDYVEVNVSATVVISSKANPDNIMLKVKEQLNTFLNPLTGGPDGSGWPFGRSVYKSEIYELLERIEGVDYIKEMVLTAQGAGTVQDAGGNYTITPQSLVYLGDHEVKIIAPGQVYCGKGGT